MERMAGIKHAYSACVVVGVGDEHGVVVAITATSVAEQTARGDALFTLMLNRHGRHALDLALLRWSIWGRGSSGLWRGFGQIARASSPEAAARRRRSPLASPPSSSCPRRRF
jgi:hypothetical protein